MRRGFTLVELSIVLVIIGLLIGGILAAQSMIGTARIQAQVRQFQQFDISVTNFHSKFNLIPGDCGYTCNRYGEWDGFGGDGKIEDGDGNAPAHWMDPEAGFFFIDLYNAGEISTQYTYSGQNISNLGPGKRFPNADIGHGGWLVITNAAGDIYYTSAPRGFTQDGSDRSFYPNTGNFSPSESLALDLKIDDGLPSSGNITAWDQGTNQDNTAGAIYPFHVDANGGYYGGWAACVTNDAIRQYNASQLNPVYPNASQDWAKSCRLQVKSNFQ